jgi:predicted dehydrogenase
LQPRQAAKLAGDWRGTRGNFGPQPGQMIDLVRREDLRDARRRCSPTRTSTSSTSAPSPTSTRPIALAALRAGKHVLVEKAIALTPADADAMVVGREGRRQTAHGRARPAVLPGVRLRRRRGRGAGKYGKLLAAHLTRVIAKPDWSVRTSPTPTKTGGPAVDLHIHDTHFIGLVCGVPKNVFAVGSIEQGAVTYLTTAYLYGPGGPAVTCSSGALSMSGRPFAHGYEIYLERATLLYDSGGVPLTLLTQDGQSAQPALSGGGDPLSAFADELQTAVDGVASGAEPPLLSGKLARDALVLCHREIESVKTGKAVAVS